MNPMTNMKNVIKLSEQELKTSNKTSWHDQYKDSAWIFIGGLSYDMSEGDIICVFSQFGEVVNINLVRDKATGKPKGFCFLCYEDQRSTVLAVDNLNGIKLLKRTIRVDHVQDYKVPKESKKNPIDEETKLIQNEGCGPNRFVNLESQSPTVKVTPKSNDITKEETEEVATKQKKTKKKKSKKKKKKEKRKKELNSSDSNSDDDSDSSVEKAKKKKKSKKSSNENSSDDSEIKKSKKKKKKRKQKQKKESSSDDSSSNSDIDTSVKKEKVDPGYDVTENQFLQKSIKTEKDEIYKKERRDDSERSRGENPREDRRNEERRNEDRSRRDNRERYNDDRNRFERESDVKYAPKENRHEYSHKKDYNYDKQRRSVERDYGRRHGRDHNSHERKRRHSPERHYDRKKYRN